MSAEVSVRSVYQNAFVTRDTGGAVTVVCIIAGDTGQRISSWCLTEDDAWASAAQRLKPKEQPDPVTKRPRVRVVLARDDEPVKQPEKPEIVEACDLFAGEEP